MEYDTLDKKTTLLHFYQISANVDFIRIVCFRKVDFSYHLSIVSSPPKIRRGGGAYFLNLDKEGVMKNLLKNRVLERGVGFQIVFITIGILFFSFLVW